MGTELFNANLAVTAVLSGGTDAPSPGATETWTVTSSAMFGAAVSEVSQFHVADTNTAKSSEMIAVTNVSGTTWTVTRGAEGTTPVAHVAGFSVYQVVTTGFLTAAAPNWVNAVTQFGGNIQAALLSFGTLTNWSAGTGGTVFLPQGVYYTTETLIIPSNVTLRGAGPFATFIHLTPGSNCDIIQTATYDSSSQAAITGVSASSIVNAFFAGVEDLAIQGDAFDTPPAGYYHGINITLNPYNTQAGSDPYFDPQPTVRNVIIKAVTGDGIYHYGRSGALYERITVENANGNGFTSSFDTTFVDCLSTSNNLGFYMPYGSVCGTGCKSYNNDDQTWVSGYAYTAGTAVVYDNSGTYEMFYCISDVTSSTPPSSDATHWTHLTSATFPQGTGYGYWWNAGEQNWAACDSQENSAGDYYLSGEGITVVGSSTGVNFNNGQPDFNSGNPNNYASVTFDGAVGCTAIINSHSQSNGAVICTTKNSPSNCTLIASTDGTESAVFSGTQPTLALVNGQMYSGVGIPVNTALVTAPVTLTDASTVSVNAALGNDFRLALTASGHTIGSPSNPADGQVIRFQIAQPSSSGPYTVSWNSVYDFGATGTPTLSTGASKVDIIGFVYNASLTKFCYLGSALGN